MEKKVEVKHILFIISCVGVISCSSNLRSSNEPFFQHHEQDSSKRVIFSTIGLAGEAFNGKEIEVSHFRNFNDDNEFISIDFNDQDEKRISLPQADIEVKNFSIEKLLKTDSGFKILFSWGGADFFYNRKLSFQYIDSKFYLVEVESKDMIEGIYQDKEIVIPTSFILFENISFMDYIE